MTATPSRRSSVREEDLRLALGEHPEGLELAVYVQPRASRTRWAGLHDDRIKVALASPPIPRRRYRQGGNQCAHTGAAGKGTANQGAKGGAALTDKYGNLI